MADKKSIKPGSPANNPQTSPTDGGRTVTEKATTQHSKDQQRETGQSSKRKRGSPDNDPRNHQKKSPNAREQDGNQIDAEENYIPSHLNPR